MPSSREQQGVLGPCPKHLKDRIEASLRGRRDIKNANEEGRRRGGKSKSPQRCAAVGRGHACFLGFSSMPEHGRGLPTHKQVPDNTVGGLTCLQTQHSPWRVWASSGCALCAARAAMVDRARQWVHFSKGAINIRLVLQGGLWGHNGGRVPTAHLKHQLTSPTYTHMSTIGSRLPIFAAPVVYAAARERMEEWKEDQRWHVGRQNARSFDCERAHGTACPCAHYVVWAPSGVAGWGLRGGR